MRNHTARWALLGAAMLLQINVPAFADSSGGPYTLTKQSIAGGGGAVANEGYSAIVTAGQTAPGAASGGSFELLGGFHSAPAPVVLDDVFQNGFEN